METILWIILVTSLAGIVGTGLGGVIGALFKKDSSKVTSLLLSFAAGVMLAVVCFDLMQGALKPGDESVDVPWYLVVIFVLVGYFLVQGLNYLLDRHTKKEVAHVNESHPKAHDSLDELIHVDHINYHKKGNQRLFFAGVVMALVIALHNLPEGMVIGASYAEDGAAIIGGTGLIMAIVIGFHNIPEGMAVAVPLINGGMNKFKAILITACTGIPTVIGAVVGYLLGLISPIMLSICLSLASGAMLYAVFGELIPESLLMWKSKLPALFLLIGLLVGFALVLI